MFRATFVAVLCVGMAIAGVRGQGPTPEFHMMYVPNHRATYVQEWKYSFPKREATRWFIALRYPPELAWSRQVQGKAELLTSAGWKPFKEVREQSNEKRRMLVIDFPHDDPKLKHGFTVRTTLTATIYDQTLTPGRPSHPVAPLTKAESASYLAETNTFDFNKPNVKKWMDEHHMWKGSTEPVLVFVHRVYKELRLHLPYNTRDGGPWICSRILQAGFGECCRHAVVGTSILRANKIPARTVCGPWAIDAKSHGGHCWGEFFLDGAGWVPYDTTLDGDHLDSEAYFASKKGEVLAGMVDFDWVIDAGTFGKQTVFAIDAFPAFWSAGQGSMDNQKLDSTTSVRLLRKFH